MRASLPFLFLALTACGFGGRVTVRNVAALGRDPLPAPHKVSSPELPGARLAVTWVGHATVLVQLEDRFVMTDPVLTDRVGELAPRLVARGLDPEAVPPLAAVVISHMHFDHLSFESLEMIEPKVGVLFLPPGSMSSLPRYDFEMRELDRWQSREARGVVVTGVPVRHVGGRYGVDQLLYPRAFSGYVFQYRGLTVYFGGDTAYAKADFTAAKQRFGHIDAALLPICPGEPRDFMKHTHMDTSEALDGFEDLGADVLVPIHFDTFINSDDAFGECPRLLMERARARGLAGKVALLTQGEQRVLVARGSGEK